MFCVIQSHLLVGYPKISTRSYMHSVSQFTVHGNGRRSYGMDRKGEQKIELTDILSESTPEGNKGDEDTRHS